MPSGPARVLPFVTSNPDVTRIDYADIQALNPGVVRAELELDAYEHWIFDQGDSGGLSGLKEGKALTLQSAAPTYETDFITVGDYADALLTDLNDRDDWGCVAVVKYPAAGTVVAGTVESATNGGSLLVGTDANQEVASFVRGPSTSLKALNLSATPSTGDWIAVAMALDYSGSNRRRTLVKGSSYVEYTDDSADKGINGTTRKIAIGNPLYNSSPYSTSLLSIHSFVLFDWAPTRVELEGMLEREIIRAARRGITAT